MRVYHCKQATISLEWPGQQRLRCRMLEDHAERGGLAGQWNITSQLKSVDFERGVAITQNSIYVWEV